MQNAQIELLVLAVQEGDQRAFGILYQHFTPQLKKYAALRVSQYAEDLVQNTWLRIQRDLRKLEDVRVFKSWLYRALRWEILDWCKRAEQTRMESLEGVPEPIAPEVSQPSTLPLLAILAADEREVTELFYLHELSQEEISLSLGIPLGTVKSRLHRAREQLKAHYQMQREESNHEH